MQISKANLPGEGCRYRDSGKSFYLILHIPLRSTAQQNPIICILPLKKETVFVFVEVSFQAFCLFTDIAGQQYRNWLQHIYFFA